MTSRARDDTPRTGSAPWSTTQAISGVFVVLPPKPVPRKDRRSVRGQLFLLSGSANNLKNRMAKAFTLGAGATLMAKVNYGIEVGYDYANVIVSTDAAPRGRRCPRACRTRPWKRMASTDLQRLGGPQCRSLRRTPVL